MKMKGTKAWLIVMAAVSATVPAAANDNLTGPVQAKIVHIIDGDTIKARVHMWLDQSIEVSVRIRGIDAPELRQPRCAHEEELAQTARDEVMSLIGDQAITLYDIGHDKYSDRVVAQVLTSANVDIGKYLINRGYAKPWNGRGKKPEWCDFNKP